jgi:hypothetical protein
MLRLDNCEKILKIVDDYAKEHKLDYHELMLEICDVIEEEKDNSKHLDSILEIWMGETKQSIYYAEEEVYSVVSVHLEKIAREDILEQVEQEDYDDLMSYLDEKYKKIFSDYYKKRKRIDPRDFDECVISVSKSYGLDNDIAEIFVSIFIEENILGIKL